MPVSFISCKVGVLCYVPRPFRLPAANRWCSFCQSWESAVTLVPEWCLYRRETHSRTMGEKMELLHQSDSLLGLQKMYSYKTVTVVAYTFAFIGAICLRSPSRQWLAVLCLVYGKTYNWHLVAIHKENNLLLRKSVIPKILHFSFQNERSLWHKIYSGSHFTYNLVYFFLFRTCA